MRRDRLATKRFVDLRAPPSAPPLHIGIASPACAGAAPEHRPHAVFAALVNGIAYQQAWHDWGATPMNWAGTLNQQFTPVPLIDAIGSGSPGGARVAPHPGCAGSCSQQRQFGDVLIAVSFGHFYP